MINNLYEFTKTIFDFDKFFNEKACEITGIKNWMEYKDGEITGNVLGSVITCVILHDGYNYSPNKKGEVITNKLKEIRFKIKKNIENVGVSLGDRIAGNAFKDQGGYFSPVVVLAKPYGNNGFLSDLSIEVSEFRKIEKKK